MDQLSQAFLQLFDLVIMSMRQGPSHPPGPPSYNVILTLEHLYVIPRSKEKYAFSKTGEVSILSYVPGHKNLMLLMGSS